MSKTFLVIGVLAVILLGYVYFRGVNKNQPEGVQNVSTQTAAPETAPAATPSTAASESGIMNNETVVNITANGFEPKSVNVMVGTKVTWKNMSGEAVSIASAVHPTHLLYPPLNLGTVADGTSVSLIFPKAGSYKYHNHLNSSMIGTVTVVVQ